MADLILRPSGNDNPRKAWALQLRWHESVGPTEYLTLCYVSLDGARKIIRAGKPYWLFGDPVGDPSPTSTTPVIACASCRFWRRGRREGYAGWSETSSDGALLWSGRCTRRAPAVRTDGAAAWPETLRDDRCGEHAPVEAADADATA